MPFLLTRRVLKVSRTNLALEDRFLEFNNCKGIAREQLDNFFFSEGNLWAHCLQRSRDAQLDELASTSILVDLKLQWGSLRANFVQLEAMLWRIMNSVFFDVPSRIASYAKLKKARLEVIKDVISLVEAWNSSDLQHQLLHQLSIIKKSIRSNDFKISSKDINALSLGMQLAEAVIQAIILLHRCQSSTTTKLATTKLKQTKAVPSLGEKKSPDVFVVRNYAAELVGNHPTSSFSLDPVLVSPKEVSFFETAPTLPSLQAAIFEAATFAPCPLAKDLQPVWDIPLELKPQAAPLLQHIPKTSVTTRKIAPTQPTLRTAVLEGLYELVDDKLEPIPPQTFASFQPAIILSSEAWDYNHRYQSRLELLSRNLFQHSHESSECFFADNLGFMQINCIDVGFKCPKSFNSETFLPMHKTDTQRSGFGGIYTDHETLDHHHSRFIRRQTVKPGYWDFDSRWKTTISKQTAYDRTYEPTWYSDEEIAAQRRL